jgi:hypothetical protein
MTGKDGKEEGMNRARYLARRRRSQTSENGNHGFHRWARIRMVAHETCEREVRVKAKGKKHLSYLGGLL